MKTYEDKVMDAFEAICARDTQIPEGERGASPAEVVEEMQRRGTLSPADTVIDIADIMKELGKKGRLGRPR